MWFRKSLYQCWRKPYFRTDADWCNTAFFHFPSENQVCFFLLFLPSPSFSTQRNKLERRRVSDFFFLLYITKKILSLKGAGLRVFTPGSEAGIFLVTYLQNVLNFSPQIPQRLDVWSSNRVLRNIGPLKASRMQYQLPSHLQQGLGRRAVDLLEMMNGRLKKWN